jgi:hypothetical protein
MHFVSRPADRRSILSPTAKPFIAESVKDFLQEQDMEGAAVDLARTPDERQQDLDRRLDALNSMMRDYEIDDMDKRRTRTPSPPLVPVLGSPLRFGPVPPPTPAESVQPVSVYDRISAPMVRVTKEVWESMGKELDLVKKQKRQAEKQHASLERQHIAHLDEDHDVGTRLGKLKYQNEANRDQKATMGRALAQKEVEIKQQQLDIENLNKKIVELEDELNQCGQIKGEADWLRDTIKESARELATHTAAVRNLEEAVQRLTKERDAAINAQDCAEDHTMRAQKLADTLTKREKSNIDQREKLLEEQMRVRDLEDKVERLLEKVDQECLDDLKEKLSEKTSQCDRFRNQLKETEHQLKLSQSRLMTAMNGGDALKGGAHLVVPNSKSILSKVVMPCSECYALNNTCDNGARCRSCVERNAKCARWRCSMKHKLGECHLAPCILPHDPQGWLIMGDRPQW